MIFFAGAREYPSLAFINSICIRRVQVKSKTGDNYKSYIYTNITDGNTSRKNKVKDSDINITLMTRTLFRKISWSPKVVPSGTLISISNWYLYLLDAL